MLKTLDNSLELLKYFTREKRQWGVRELAKEMNISHTAVYRMLATFERYGFIKKEAKTNKYELGYAFLEYASILRDNLDITQLIHPVMKKVVEETNESVFLTWLDGEEGICLDIAESRQPVKYALSVGSRTVLHAGASNKVIMAYLPSSTQAAILDRGLLPRTGHTVREKDKLLQQLSQIRQDGWAYSVGEYTDSVFGIAVPLFAQDRQVVASLTIAGPDYRMPREKVPGVLQVLQAAQQEIQSLLHRIL
ncbi:IclR family transcriptional regulator [Brevibacillus ruminantium]|uniref:IclR family transcriptional regulator n=1 Tax=Brevibacillus ruminantium TaxID=2950604 RepID=A0ABY4WEF4_9BACL|nr:IclR family transcriptional regulator [Brevibacillus ruminantium]USG65532.1 IclR family transcriptional regulator [Brevibacillus ruminantium]